MMKNLNRVKLEREIEYNYKDSTYQYQIESNDVFYKATYFLSEDLYPLSKETIHIDYKKNIVCKYDVKLNAISFTEKESCMFYKYELNICLKSNYKNREIEESRFEASQYMNQYFINKYDHELSQLGVIAYKVPNNFYLTKCQTFSNALKNFINKKYEYLTIKQMKEKSGISPKYFEKIYYGERLPSKIEIKKLCRGFGFSKEKESLLLQVSGRYVDNKEKSIDILIDIKNNFRYIKSGKMYKLKYTQISKLLDTTSPEVIARHFKKRFEPKDGITILKYAVVLLANEEEMSDIIYYSGETESQLSRIIIEVIHNYLSNDRIDYIKNDYFERVKEYFRMIDYKTYDSLKEVLFSFE